jgi:CRISPR-associated protein Cas5h
MQLVSFDLQSNFGFFRKPETNNTLNVSYNMMHKPALLGILGAIIGLAGYRVKGELPEYYQKLSDIKIGIAPLNHDNGNFSKTSIKYSNTVGYANKGTTFLTEELTLISPKYRVYLLLDVEIETHNRLLDNLEKGNSEFIPYFGKNEFTAWWDKQSVLKYNYSLAALNEHGSVPILTLFARNQNITKNSKVAQVDFLADWESDENPFMYFERLPVGFNLDLMQYQLEEMVFSNYEIKNAHTLPNLYHLSTENHYVQLH